MYKFGLKLWSTNSNYVAEAAKLYRDGIYDYIEIYAVPGSFSKYIAMWEKVDIPFVIHAPHFRGGMNLAKGENEEKNQELIKETQQFADKLKAERIIVHPGIAGNIKETVRQLKIIGDERILIENKPYHALDDNLTCNGTTPPEIKYIISKTGLRFCLDIGHAVCAANGHGQDPFTALAEYIKLKPDMYHLTDGDFDGVLDRHDHIGVGNFDFRNILSYLPTKAMITIETDKDSTLNLDDFVRDIKALNNYEKN